MLSLATVALTMVCVSALTVAAPADATGRGNEADVGPHRVVSRGPWTATARKGERPDDVWVYYKHGIVDHFATPVAWSDLLGDGQSHEGLLDRAQLLDTPYRASAIPSVVLHKSADITFERPLPLDIAAVRGRRIRVFVWLKGHRAAGSNSWHAPSMNVTMRSADGKILSSADGYFQTQGTYPWHCYHTDRFVPEAASGVYIKLYNKFRGTAWFTTLSWETVTPDNTYSNDEKQDPVTGSLAFNTRHDQMPFHLKHGFGWQHPWRFVLGQEAGLVGQPYDITTKEGFRTYYFEKAKKDSEHMNHAILYMQSMYRNGTKRGMLPPMEPGWLENFARILIDDQDPQTGFWHDGKALSLGLTFHLCDMHFRYYGIKRSDRDDLIYSGQDLGLKRVPRAERIIRTVLAMQSSYVDEAGVRRKAAWNRKAYRYVTDPDAYKQNCYMGTTWDAIYLMRLASRYVGEDLQKEVYQSVRSAFRFVLHRIVQPDGVWLQHDTDTHPTKGDYMGGILRDISWLERRVIESLPVPDVSGARHTDDVIVSWRRPSTDQNSVRIYVAPRGVATNDITEAHLVGVIHRTGHTLPEMDPFLAVQVIRQAGVRRWGGKMDLPPPEHWRGRKYLPWKLRMVKYPLARSDDLAALIVSLPDGQAVDLFAAAVTWYGEESALVKVEFEQ